MTTLLGIAIIGKNNEPLYLCDCDNVANKNNTETTNNDPFGFATASPAPRDSLSLERQITLHAALDCLEEMVHSGLNGQIPVIKSTTGNVPGWVGLLLEQDDEAVYAHVSATNIKFLALTSGQSPAKSMQTFFKELHQAYIAYIMNPFCNTRGPIESVKFDSRVKKAVKKIQNPDYVVD